jgi:hypothetical protein
MHIDIVSLPRPPSSVLRPPSSVLPWQGNVGPHLANACLHKRTVRKANLVLFSVVSCHVGPVGGGRRRRRTEGRIRLQGFEF